MRKSAYGSVDEPSSRSDGTLARSVLLDQLFISLPISLIGLALTMALHDAGEEFPSPEQTPPSRSATEAIDGARSMLAEKYGGDVIFRAVENSGSASLSPMAVMCCVGEDTPEVDIEVGPTCALGD